MKFLKLKGKFPTAKKIDAIGKGFSDKFLEQVRDLKGMKNGLKKKFENDSRKVDLGW